MARGVVDILPFTLSFPCWTQSSKRVILLFPGPLDNSVLGAFDYQYTVHPAKICPLSTIVALDGTVFFGGVSPFPGHVCLFSQGLEGQALNSSLQVAMRNELPLTQFGQSHSSS